MYIQGNQKKLGIKILFSNFRYSFVGMGSWATTTSQLKKIMDYDEVCQAGEPLQEPQDP